MIGSHCRGDNTSFANFLLGLTMESFEGDLTRGHSCDENCAFETQPHQCNNLSPELMSRQSALVTPNKDKLKRLSNLCGLGHTK